MALIIFDFDGTLVDSFNCMVDKFIHLADDFGFKKIELEHINQLRNYSSLEIIRYLNIPYYKIPLVIRAVRKLLRSSMPELKAIPGVSDVIQQLHQEGHQLGIATSNSKENVETWLSAQQLAPHFLFIATESSFFSKHKILKKILKKNKMNAADTWYVGDETRDIDAGKKVGMKTIAVSWGYNSVEILKEYKPDVIVSQPADLLKHFKGTLIKCP